jgi:hypothetical protein
MRSDSGLHEPRTNAEQSETAPEFRVTDESQSEWADLERPVERDEDKRLFYYENQLQRDDGYRGYLDEIGIPIDEMRALLAELTDYFGVCSHWAFPLPPKGLPGYLRDGYDRNEEAAELLLLGIQYAGAVIHNERKTMHNRWRSARALIQKIEERVELRVNTQIIEEQIRGYDEQRQVEQMVYFIGSASGPIKIGIAARPTDRLKGLQTGHHERLELLATCQGGQELERAYHKRFAARRLNGEWFERCPEIETEIERLNA